MFSNGGYDSVLRHYLIDGFRFGFRINFVGERAVSECTSLKDGSRQLYRRAWPVFRNFSVQFYGSANPSLPLFPHCIPLFISYHSFRKLAFSTISSYLAAISYVHKLRGFPDPTKSFLI